MFRHAARSLRAAALKAHGSAVDRFALQLSSTSAFPQHASTGFLVSAEQRCPDFSQYRCFSSRSLVSPGGDTGAKRIYISKTGRRKKPTRKEVANYADTLGEEAELWPNAENVLGKFPHAYNPRDIVDPAMNEDAETGMMAQVTMDDFDEVEEHVDPPPYPGATPFLRWQIRFVFQVGDDMHHPMNRLVKLSFDVHELQKNCDLTDAGLERFVLLVGNRFKPTKGLERGQDKPQGAVTLTSNKYADREDNRRDLMQIFRALVKEASLAGTPEDPLLECSDYKQLVGGTK